MPSIRGMALLVSLVLALGSAAAPGAPSAAAAGVGPLREVPPPARVRMLAGRATAHTPEGSLELGGGARREIATACQLVLGWGDQAEVAWDGRASVRVSGPASLEWAPPWTDGSHLAWRVAGARVLDAEVRRGPVRLLFERAGWTVVAGASAFAAEGLPGGAVRLANRAGVPLEAVADGPADGEPSRVRVHQGRGVRLRALPERR